MKIEMLDERIESQYKQRNGYKPIIDDFLRSDKKTMIITCDNEGQAKQCINTIRHYKDYHDLDIVLWRDNCNVYVLKG